jgi:predicted enzyme related to lactoylglutathione lyase
MSTIISAVSIDTADAAALAAFWAEVLGRPVNPGATADYAAIDATDPASGPKITFHKVPELKTVKNRVRLALRTDRFEAESLRLADLGAKPLGDYEKPSLRWTTFADPEGNEFDLVTVPPVV